MSQIKHLLYSVDLCLSYLHPIDATTAHIRLEVYITYKRHASASYHIKI
jgi:hypothetical protein